MTPTRDDILDLPPRKKQSVWQLRLFYMAVVLFVYWFVAPYAGMPLAGAALILGLLAFAMLSVLRFRKNRRSGLYQYFYLLGHLTLLAGLGLYLMKLPYSAPLFWVSFAGFGLGLLLLNRPGKS